MTTLRLPLTQAHARRRPWASNRILRRLAADVHALLALGLVITACLVAVAGQPGDIGRVAPVSGAFLVAQLIPLAVGRRLRTSPTRETIISFARFGLAILYVAAVTGLLRTGEFRPTAALFIPVVALAAVQGNRHALLVGTAAITLFIMPVVSATGDTLTLDVQRAIALGGTAILLSIGTRRSISALTVTVQRLGTLLARDRRRSRQVAAVERVGRLLASTGPSPDTLERIVGLLAEDIGYHFVSIYFGSSTRMRLAAQRGDDATTEELDGHTGVIGRVMRTRKLAFIRDTSTDGGDDEPVGDARSGICAPIVADGELLGIVHVEARGPGGLDRSDVGTVSLVAERMASALALAGERERLRARAELFRRLTSFAAAVNGTLDPARVHEAIVAELRDVLVADTVVLSVLDRPTGRHVVRAVAGREHGSLALQVETGEGLTGRAIRDRIVVVGPGSDPSTDEVVLPRNAAEPTTGVATPLVRDDVVVGALTLLRQGVDRPWADDELEALPIIAGLVALAITNTFLHADVTELSVRDPLTGLFNRRYLDTTMARLDSLRARREPARRERAAVAIFDLDHFGEINKQHGHLAGDAILRAFADILRTRFRGADVVARYGGEEFLAILDEATVAQAVTAADEIRTAFALIRVAGSDGTPIGATVSAGCAAIDGGDDRLDDIVARADVGLVMAKRAGRNRVIAA